MRVKLIRRWGPNPAGESVNVDPTMGSWLVQHAFGTASDVTAPSHEATPPGVVSEGEEDPPRGEVPTRHRPPVSDKPAQTGRRRKAATPE